MSEGNGSQSKPVNRGNVGRIAERIVANELEYRGFRVSDLNSGGTSANADLLAVGHDRTWQIQVKGATNENSDWWFQYGYCTEEIIEDHRPPIQKPMFNRKASFYRADFVVLVAVHSPIEYCCIVMPVYDAEKAAQFNMDRDYREPKLIGGGQKKPNKVWISIDHQELEKPNPNERQKRSAKLFVEERLILDKYRNKWDVLNPYT